MKLINEKFNEFNAHISNIYVNFRAPHDTIIIVDHHFTILPTDQIIMIQCNVLYGADSQAIT